MPLDDSTFQLIIAAFLSLASGGAGIRWYMQKRNGNGVAKASDIHSLEKQLSRRIGDNYTNTQTRIDEFRKWLTEVEGKQDAVRDNQAAIRERLGRCEGWMESMSKSLGVIASLVEKR